MAKVKITYDNENFEFECDKRDTFLEASQEEGIATPFGCTSGSCQMCMAKVLKGECTPGEFNSLSSDMIAKGYILTCQSHPQSDEVHISFDEN